MGVASEATPGASIHPKYPGANRVEERIEYDFSEVRSLTNRVSSNYADECKDDREK